MHHFSLEVHIKERVHARKCGCILSYHREDILDVFFPNVIAIHMRDRSCRNRKARTVSKTLRQGSSL